MMTPHPQSSVHTPFPVEPVISALLIEDDVYYGKLIQRTLRTPSPNFKVKWATNLASAMQMILDSNFDVIISDLELPDATGLQALQAIREVDAQVPVVILTGHNESGVGLRAIRAGADDFIIKERVSADSLVRSVRYAVERKKCEELNARLEAIKDFTGMLAHDLRAPLVGASRVLECLDGSETSPEDKAELVRHLRESNLRLLNLVTQLIEIYRLEMTPPTVQVRACSLLSSLTCAMEATTAMIQLKRLRVKIDVAPDFPSVECDRVGLERLLSNLLDNACKFAPADSEVEVRASATEDGEHVRIEVIDHGQGVPAEARQSLFKRFWYGSPGKAYSSSGGLGLYLCHKIVTANGGAISFESENGRTMFTVVLPAGRP